MNVIKFIFLRISITITYVLFSSAFLYLPLSAQTGEKIPEWANNAVWYQIFPERFCNGDNSNNPTADRVGKSGSWNIGAPDGWKLSDWNTDWYNQDEWEKNFSSDFYTSVSSRRYGGDLQGVIDKLEYLSELGISVIYFNPIFDAVSLHKYDASHYHHIDRFFGPDPIGDWEIMQREDPANPETWEWTSADLLFLNLIEKAHSFGIRIVIDGVWNHTGRDFWAFRDIIENGEESRFKNWYKIEEFGKKYDDGFDYKGWWGYKGLPEFTEIGEDLHPEVKEHIFAVTKRWMAPNGDTNKGIDGWRLDVAEEIGMLFWKDWIAIVKSINPEAITVAEIWNDAARQYIGDEYFDVVMNYRWAYATHAFFINESLSVSEFDEKLNSLRNDFPKPVNLSMLNMMDSHDTERLATMIVNKDNAYKENSKLREAKNPQDYSVEKPSKNDINLQKLIALFQYTYVGSPMIYYGTEAGMWGADDPDDRKPMVWPDIMYDDEANHPFNLERKKDVVKFNQELHNWYAKLAKIRADYESTIGTGDYKTVLVDDNKKVFAFIRYDEKDNFAIVIINRGKNDYNFELKPDSMEISNIVNDLISGNIYNVENGSIIISVPAVSGKILVK
jgi:cyclomaltodextrinase / maltogenic alpha-amylase / neopullulanase